MCRSLFPLYGRSMAGTGADPLVRAEHFIWLTARVLEQRRFAHRFLDGDPDPVETALTAYRNEDGGYAHALEPDLRGPVSQPLHTAHALSVLDSIGRCEGLRVERICRYLSDVSTKEGALPALLPLQRGYPAAPFVPLVDDPPAELLATGPIVGLLHRNEVWHAWLFRATDFCWSAVDALEQSHPYEIEAAIAFLDGVPDRTRAERAADRLGGWCAANGSRYWIRPGGRSIRWRRATRRASTTSRTTTPVRPGPWPAAGSPTGSWSARSTTWRPSSRRTAAGR